MIPKKTFPIIFFSIAKHPLYITNTKMAVIVANIDIAIATQAFNLFTINF